MNILSIHFSMYIDSDFENFRMSGWEFSPVWNSVFLCNLIKTHAAELESQCFQMNRSLSSVCMHRKIYAFIVFRRTLMYSLVMECKCRSHDRIYMCISIIWCEELMILSVRILQELLLIKLQIFLKLHLFQLFRAWQFKKKLLVLLVCFLACLLPIDPDLSYNLYLLLRLIKYLQHTGWELKFDDRKLIKEI
jgi:hypothetical protein